MKPGRTRKSGIVRMLVATLLIVAATSTAFPGTASAYGHRYRTSYRAPRVAYRGAYAYRPYYRPHYAYYGYYRPRYRAVVVDPYWDDDIYYARPAYWYRPYYHHRHRPRVSVSIGFTSGYYDPYCGY